MMNDSKFWPKFGDLGPVEFWEEPWDITRDIGLEIEFHPLFLEGLITFGDRTGESSSSAVIKNIDGPRDRLQAAKGIQRTRRERLLEDCVEWRQRDFQQLVHLAGTNLNDPNPTCQTVIGVLDQLRGTGAGQDETISPVTVVVYAPLRCLNSRGNSWASSMMISETNSRKKKSRS